MQPGQMVIADGLAEKGRSLPLDVLRGIAILLVLLRHAVIPPGAAGHLGRYIAWTERFGWTGVDLFFVLSGFLIGGLLFREAREEGNLRIKQFLIRRAFKIWPGYFVFLAFVAATDWYHHLAIKPLWSNLLQVQNYVGTPLLHTWSLSVEEHFYLLLPLVLLALLRTGKLPWTPWLMLLTCAGCLGLRLMNLI